VALGGAKLPSQEETGAGLFESKTLAKDRAAPCRSGREWQATIKLVQSASHVRKCAVKETYLGQGCMYYLRMYVHTVHTYPHTQYLQYTTLRHRADIEVLTKECGVVLCDAGQWGRVRQPSYLRPSFGCN
jgi:hypothetical protein